MPAPDESLPAAIREGVQVSREGVCTWDFAEVRDVIDAARSLDFASLGGEPYVETPGGCGRVTSLRWEPGPRAAGEPWERYVARSAREVADGFEARCTDAALGEAAAGIRFVRESGLDPLDHIRAALRFRGPDGVVVPRPPDPRPQRARSRAAAWGWYLVPPLGFAPTVLLAAIHPLLGGAAFLASFFACAAAAIHLLVGQPGFRWPGRALLFVWNAVPPIGIIAAIIVAMTVV